MTLNRNHWFVRYAFLLKFLTDGYVPRQTNLCTFFWLAVLVVPCQTALIIAVSPIIGFVFGMMWLEDRGVFGRLGDRVGVWRERSVIVAYVRARKQRLCPIIELR